MTRIQRFAAVAGIALSVACSRDSDHSLAPASPSDAEAVVSLHLATSTPVVKVGEPLSFSLRIVNSSKRSVTLVLPGDGSEDGMRTPRIRWTPESPRRGRCGNINCLRSDEVFTLAPGEERELGDWVGRPELPGPGTHRVAVTYENVPDLGWSGVPLGDHDEAAMERIRRSTPVRSTSNAIEVVVRN